jgi:hypothetical protein
MTQRVMPTVAVLLVERVSHAGQEKGDDPDTKGYSGPLSRGLERETNHLTSVKTDPFFTKPNNGCQMNIITKGSQRLYNNVIELKILI